MITKVSNVKTNKSQSFGTAYLVNLKTNEYKPLAVTLENKVISNLTNKVNEGKFELDKVDFMTKYLKAENGAKVDVRPKKMLYESYINYFSSNGNHRVLIVKDKKTDETTSGLYDILYKAFQGIKPKN